MYNFLKPVTVGIALALAAPMAIAEDISFLTRPNGESLPLFVLQAKAAEFLPEGTNVVLHAVAPNKEAVIAALRNQDVDYATVFHAMGATLYQNGVTHLQLAGVHGWGGVGILSRVDIEPGDWDALNGTMGLITPGTHTPPHKMAMAAMMANDINPRADLIFAGTGVHNAFTQMQSADNAPDFVVMPEPQLSHGLMMMQAQGWENQYHLFADAVQSVSDFGVPLGAFWVVGEQENAVEVVAGFDQAVAYMMDPANREEVAQIIAQGWADTFDKHPSAQVFINVLDRGMLRLNFKSAAAMEAKLRMVWALNDIAPDRGVIWHGNDFLVPGQAFLISQMLPRHVGMALAYGDELQLTPRTRMAAIRIRAWAHAPMFEQFQKNRAVEMEILAAYQENNWEAVDVALVRLADIRLESSRIQVGCIQRTIEEYAPEDIEKIRVFMAENADLVAAFSGM